MMNRLLWRAGSRARLRYGCSLVLAVLFALPGAPALSAEINIEQQIKAGLVPPVMVEGEPPTLTPISVRMEALHVPAVSIAVIRNGKLVWAGGFGTRSKGGRPVTADTLFQAGSVSKAVTAVAVMELVQARQLDLDADVNEYLKSWKLPPSSFTDRTPVTLRELLSHSAGVTVSGFGGYESGEPIPTLVQVLNGEPPARNPPIRVDVAPGTMWRYSGGGYVILQQVLLDTTGASFPQLMREKVLAPFGMNQSTFQQPLPADLVARAAMPYAADGTPVKGGPHVYPEMGPAGLWTTSSDLARFAIGVQRALAGLSGRTLSQATARTMLGPAHTIVSPVHEFNHNGHRQGLGLIVVGDSDRKYFEHHGSNQGYSSYVMAYESGDGAAIMINTSSDDGARLIDEIVRTIAHAYHWPDLVPPRRRLTTIPPASFDRYVGAYRSASGDLATFWRDGKHLESRIWGESASEVFPTSSREYFSRTADRIWVFGDEKGTVSGVKLNQSGDEQALTRLDDREGRAAVERSIEIEKRMKNQTPVAGGEQALLESIAGVLNGMPNYDRMVPAFAQAVRRELSGLQKILREPGAVRSASFKRVLPNGADVYSVTFQRESRDLEILMAPDGRIHFVMFNR